MLNSQIRKSLLLFLLAFFVSGILWSTGPVDFDGDAAVSIYRDFDDGLYGRSMYRGVIFSAKLDSFDRYRTLPVGDSGSLTAYLVSSIRGGELASGRIDGLSIRGVAEMADIDDGGRIPEKWLYEYDRNGLHIVFSLETAPADLYDEIHRTYTGDLPVIETVSESYRDGYVVRIHEAENIYRPQFSEIDYEDVLISAAFIGDRFQPLWGIHDGNAMETPSK